MESCNTLSDYNLESVFVRSKLKSKITPGGESNGRIPTTSNFNYSISPDMNSEAGSGLFVLDNFSFIYFFQQIFKNLSVRISSVFPQSIKFIYVHFPSPLAH